MIGFTSTRTEEPSPFGRNPASFEQCTTAPCKIWRGTCTRILRPVETSGEIWGGKLESGSNTCNRATCNGIFHGQKHLGPQFYSLVVRPHLQGKKFLPAKQCTINTGIRNGNPPHFGGRFSKVPSSAPVGVNGKTPNQRGFTAHCCG